MTPLHLACAVGNPDSVKQLLGIAQDAKSISVSKIINEPDNNGSLPITLAITSKNLEMVEILLENGSVTEMRNSSHDTALIIASRHDNL